MAAANYLDHRMVEDRYVDRLKVVNFRPVKDERKSWEEMTASGVAVRDYGYYYFLLHSSTCATVSRTLQPVQPASSPFSLNRPTGLIQSLSRDVRLSVCLSVPLFFAFFDESAHWADSVIESQCPSVCTSVPCEEDISLDWKGVRHRAHD